MRVTHVITRLIVGGAQENTIATVLGLRKIEGVQVDLVSGPTRGAEGTLEEQIREQDILHQEPNLIRAVHPYRDILAYRGLTRRFRESRPDIVHTHSGKAGVLEGADLDCSGGILTPASSMGTRLLERLRRAGHTYEIEGG